MGTSTDEPALQLHVPASASFQERRMHTLKHAETFAVFDARGDFSGEPDSPDGLFDDGTRIVSRFALYLAGAKPLLLSATAQDDNALFNSDLTNVDLYDGERLMLSRELIHISRQRFVWDRAMYERILVRNFDDRPHSLTLALEFGADFADVFEVRGERRPHRGRVETRRTTSDVRFAYTALDGIRTVASIAFDPSPARLDDSSATFDLHLVPGEAARIFIRAGHAENEREPWRASRFVMDMREARRELMAMTAGAALVTSSNETFDEIVRRSVSDLAMLVTRRPEGPYPDAGIPWFATPFGRDGIITALFTLWIDPSLARGVLRFLAATQATDVDPRRDAEPGKIVHELRGGEMARLNEVPFGRYYGSVDATPLFVVLMGAYFDRTGDLDLMRDLWPNCAAALDWIDRYGDVDGDGFVEYERKTVSGLDNQGWKDSYDAVFHADGSLARAPIALCEVQGYVFAAKCAAANVAEALGLATEAERLRAATALLYERFDRAFWCEELGTYALALDADKAPCRVAASNAGHTLYCGIASAEHAPQLVNTLFGDTSFSGWGIRTVATGSARYNPMSYHNGSVWPHDNGLIALGLSRYGFKREAARTFEATIEAASYMDLRRLPELFCGFARRRRNAPTSYPVACSPQAWASAAPLAMLAANLGIAFDCDAREIRFQRPVLPERLEEVTLRRLTVRDASVDVLVRRHGGEIALQVLERRGDARVTVVH